MAVDGSRELPKPTGGRSAAGPKPCRQPDFHPANTMPSHRPAATRSPTPEMPTGDGHGRAMANHGQVLVGEMVWQWSGNIAGEWQGSNGWAAVGMRPGRGRAMTLPLRNGLANALQSDRCPAVARPLCTPARERSPGMGIAWKTPAARNWPGNGLPGDARKGWGTRRAVGRAMGGASWMLALVPPPHHLCNIAAERDGGCLVFARPGNPMTG